MKEDDGGWLVGSQGLHVGRPGGSWRQVGPYGHTVTCALPTADGVVVGISHGLWCVPGVDARWVQMNDETLTELKAVARTESVGTIAVSAYGVAVSTGHEDGLPRWQCLTSNLTVNERFSNTILVDPIDSSRWYVGTEGGLIVGEDDGSRWERSECFGSPVRSLLERDGGYWAGTDEMGIWSGDGCKWSRLESAPDSAVFCLAGARDGLIAGGLDGVYVQKDREWVRCGPRALITAISVDPFDADTWLAGADPGGLWFTQDAGGTWTHVSGFVRVRSITYWEGASSWIR